MLKLFKQALKVTNDSIILAIPLILFMWIINFYSLFSRYTVDTFPEFILATVTVLFMVGAFCAGWFYMIKEAISLSKKVFVLDEDRAKATFNLIKLIPAGIGKYFLSFVGMYIILFVLQILVTFIVYSIGINTIGVLDASSVEHLQAIATEQSQASDQAMMAFVNSLSVDQIIFFGKWSMLFVFVSSVAFFLIMLWFPEIIYQSQNPILALGRSIKKLFKTFFKSLGLYFNMWVIGFILLFINTFALINPIAYLVMSIVLFYYSVFVVVLLFLYYDVTFNCDKVVEETVVKKEDDTNNEEPEE